MSTYKIMKDPLYTPILFGIESRIHAANHAARATGITFNDSQVRSILNKVRKSLEGSPPKIPNESPRDQLLAALHGQLVQLKSQYLVADHDEQDEQLTTREWCLCFRTVEESIQRHSSGPGSQAYLDFLDGFIPRGESRTTARG